MQDRRGARELSLIYIILLSALLVIFIEIWYLLLVVGALLAVFFLVFRRGAAEKADLHLLLMALAGLFLVFFVALPVANLLRYSPSAISVLSDPDALASIFLSMGAALAAVLFSLIFGIPLAYVLARKDFPGKGLVESIIDVPVVVPHTVAGIALLMVLGRNSLIGSSLSGAGIRFVDAFPGIVAAMIFVSAPFLVNSIREGFEAVDPRMEHVARSLGASGFNAFLTVTLPISLRSIFMGSIMAWARAISEFGAVVIIAYYPMIAPTYIYTAFNTGGLEASRPVAVLLLLVCLTVFVTFRMTAGRWKVYDRD